MPKCAVAAFVLGLCSFAAGQNPVQMPPPSTPLPPAAPQPAPAQKDYSQQPVVINQFINRYHWEPDGTGFRRSTLSAKVQTALGLKELGQISVGYSSANEKVEIAYVRVKKPDGKMVVATPDSVQDLTAPVAREAPMYSDFRVKQIIVPGLEIGDTVEYDYRVDVVKPLAEHEFWAQHDFTIAAIVLDEQLEMDVPDSVKVQVKTNPGFEPKIETAKGRKIYRWKHANLSVETDDQTADARKRKRPDPDRRPDVQLTTFKSWEDVGAWYAGLEKGRMQGDEFFNARAKHLVEGKTTEDEKARALYDYVRQFRYVSISFGLGRYQPHAAMDVITKQYGDCKDKHTLFAALLEAVGMHADAVLISTARKLDEAVPSPAQFNHVISAVMIDGKRKLLDTTPEIAPYGLLAPSIRHKKALLVKGEKGSEIVTTPATLPFAPLQAVTLTGKLNEMGKLDGTIKIEARGDTELLFRTIFRNNPEGRWNELAQYFSKSLGLNGDATEVKTTPTGDTAEPFVAQWKIAASNVIDWTSKQENLAPPAAPIGIPEFEEADTVAKQKPMEVMGAPTHLVSTTVLTFPARYAVRLPVPVNVTRDYGEYHSEYSANGNTITIRRDFKFQDNEVPYARRSDYNAFQRAIVADQKQTLQLDAEGGSKAALPSGMSAKDLNDAGANALKSQNYRDAVRLFERLVQLEPKHATAWNNLGQSYMELHELPKAEAAFRKQIEINAYDGFAYNNLGLVLEQGNRYDDAIAAFKKQIDVNPLDKFAHGNLGLLYANRQRYAEAVPELETAANLNPQNAMLQAQLGSAYLNTNQTEKATAAFDKAVQISPSPGVWNTVAYELARKGVQLDKAQSYAESAVSNVEGGMRNYDLAHLQQFHLAYANFLAAAWDTLGWVYYQQKDPRALKYLGPAWWAAQLSENADHLAQAYEQAGKTEEAKRMTRWAVAALHPTPEAHAHAVKLMGSDAAVDQSIKASAAEILQARTFSIAKQGSVKGSADFFLLFNNAGKVDETKFVSGADAMKGYAAALQAVDYGYTPPPGSQAKMLRRATVSCEDNQKDCSVVLLPMENVTALD